MVSRIEVYNNQEKRYKKLENGLTPEGVGTISDYRSDGRYVYLIGCDKSDSVTQVVRVRGDRIVEMGNEAIILQDLGPREFVAFVRRGDEPLELTLRITPNDSGTKVRITQI